MRGMLLALFLSICAACSPPPAEQPHAAAQAPYDKLYSSGDLCAEVHLDRTRATTADRLLLRLKAEAPEDYEIALPEIENEPGGFRVVRKSAPALEFAGGTVAATHELLLEPFLAGAYRLPALTFRFTGPRNSATITSDEVPVEVLSLLPPQGAALADIFGPRTLADRRFALPALGAAALLLLAAALWLRRRRRLGQPAAAPQPLAHERAYRDLELLLAEALPRRGLMKPYYVRLSEILRGYIEERFGLRAPEQTTPEFLHALGTSPVLSCEQKRLLQEVLEHCDLVKFAKHQPSLAEADAACAAVKRFIDETRPVEEAPRAAF